MRNIISWDRALGIGVDIAPKGQRRPVDGHGPYTELALLYETWLRDLKGFPEHQLIDYDLDIQLRKEFFNENIEKHPEWFSENGVGLGEYKGETVYKCNGCQMMLDGTVLYTHKHK